MDRQKAGKGEFSKQPLKEEEEPEENPSTHICCTSSGSIAIFDNGLTNNEELPSARKKGKKKYKQRDPSPIYCKFITPN